MREYKIIHLGEWDSQDIRGTEEKVKVETLLNMKQSEQKYGFNKRIKNVDNFLDLKDVEIQFSDLSKDGWILDSIKSVERNEIPKNQIRGSKKASDIEYFERISYIAIFFKETTN
tara:strand:+ start:292 stop:636 length:345 start_codon:yes stop_codon:yes gene_type:complete